VTPTPEQTAIIAAVAAGHNCMVEALAGCAKSTTIRLAASVAKQPLILAFNKKIKDEMDKALKAEGIAAKVLTMNGLGHLAIQTSLRKRPEIDNDKLFNLAKEKNLRRSDLFDTLHLIRSARLLGLVPRGIQGKSLVPDTPETWADIAVDQDIDPIYAVPAREILIQSIKLAMEGTLDFDDQLYVSTLIFGSYPRFDTVFVDEAQDLSALNHMQVAKAAARQIVAVGDPNQAIYAWRGADADSMLHMRDLRPEWVDLPLTMTFRCPRTVVQRQHSHVPNFRAAETNLEGHIERLADWHPGGGSDAAILCRNNAPLIRTAFKLLRKKVPVNYLGRDIGANLKRLYNKLSNHGALSLDSTIANAQIEMNKDPDKADKYDSLIAILEAHDDVDSALKFLTAARTNAISLATGHKAKGLEWQRVYHLNPWMIPSKYVVDMEPEDGEESERYEKALRQENNLRYVIETRTKNELFLVNQDSLR
jgi:formiminotetrahydrofolate cyclodeaminase